MKVNDKLSFSFGKIWKSIDGTKLLIDFVGEVVRAWANGTLDKRPQMPAGRSHVMQIVQGQPVQAIFLCSGLYADTQDKA